MSDRFGSPPPTQNLSEISDTDHVDRMVYSATMQTRQAYYAACHRLGIKPRELSPIVVGMRSVQ